MYPLEKMPLSKPRPNPRQSPSLAGRSRYLPAPQIGHEAKLASDVVCHLLIGGEPGLTLALPEIQGGPDLRHNSS
ncbi:MAG: hypothetical protein Q8P59_08915, partial [Dehalococcoidia bacterium]|nr:hypothetical protein [Dehalococcoidia bacterium]